jgi:hypothetical protein
MSARSSTETLAQIFLTLVKERTCAARRVMSGSAV